MIQIDDLIRQARRQRCSDIHITPGQPVSFRRIGKLEQAELILNSGETETLIRSILSENKLNELKQGKDLDFCYVTSQDGMRQRVNVYRERGNLCCAIRILNEDIPSLDELKLPPVLKKLALLPRGLILVTGPTGSGKSTTLAAMIDYINKNMPSHIITIEDPIEYEHKNKLSLIHQREVGEDVSSFSDALRSSLREDPDVILVGEMRDYETISAALTAAETGHLVLSTLHTVGAANTIDRIIDVFPSEGQHQIRAQLSSVLQGVITQQLLPSIDGSKRVPVLEILTGNDAVRNLIRENKCHQIGALMQTSTKDGMCTLSQSLGRLVRECEISRQTAFSACQSEEELKQYIEGSR